MPAIVTITFNPAIDKSTSVPALIPEKKMHCTEPVYEPGGGGVNVARAIKKLGGEATAIYLAGGYSGEMYSRLLYKEGVSTIMIKTKGSTRENLIVEDVSAGRQYRFGMPGPEISAEEWQKCLIELQQIQNVGYIVVSGSLPLGIPVDIYSKIACIANSKQAKLIVDTSGEALKHAVKAGVFLIKPSLGELAMLAGVEKIHVDQVTETARNIIRQGNCEIIMVSMGAAGAILVTKDQAIKVAAPPVNTRSTVGAGDSMVAGMILSLMESSDLNTALQYGVACGTAATIHPGTGLSDKKFAEEAYQLIIAASANDGK